MGHRRQDLRFEPHQPVRRSTTRQVHDWTGGGLHAETNPVSNKPPDCGLVLKLSGTSYTRYYPEDVASYDCDPSYVVQVTGAVVDQAHLDANRVSQPG